MKSLKIGIGITVHNRHDIASKSIAEWVKHSFSKIYKIGGKKVDVTFRIYVVDDASKVKFPYQKGVNMLHYNFENKGIAAAKNQCLQALEECDHIFLSDDDVFPLTEDWWIPYVYSTEPHLMFTFSSLKNGKPNGNKTLLSSDRLNSFSHPCGCLLYIERRVLDVVGGFDEEFTRYGFEHVEYSSRIHNAGLTTYRYQDIPNSLELFYSLDWAQKVSSSVLNERARYIHRNGKLFLEKMDSKEYQPYKPLWPVILTTYFTTIKDSQREQWVPNIDDLKVLARSCREVSGVKLVVLTDTFSMDDAWDDVIFLKFVPQDSNPYFARWFAIRDYLSSNRHGWVWCVDATDVEMLRNPLLDLKPSYLYTGDEDKQKLTNNWLVNNHRHRLFQKLYIDMGSMPLLNAGVVGGQAGLVKKFASLICSLYDNNQRKLGLTDMAAFNYIAYTFFYPKINFGRRICTVFKAFKDNGTAYWKHK